MSRVSGWVMAVLGVGALGGSCGGRARSEAVEDGGSSTMGGSAGSAASSVGGARGGSAGTRAFGGAGGVSNPGGQAGTAPMDAATAHCECPNVDYGIEIVPNGARLSFGLSTDECPGGPVRGNAREQCGVIRLEAAACVTSDGGRPCLELLPYQEVKYVDTNGTLYLGSLAEIEVDQTGVSPDPLKVLAGSYSARLVGEAGEMVIGGRFVLCGYFTRSLVPCAL